MTYCLHYSDEHLFVLKTANVNEKRDIFPTFIQSIIPMSTFISFESYTYNLMGKKKKIFAINKNTEWTFMINIMKIFTFHWHSMQFIPTRYVFYTLLFKWNVYSNLYKGTNYFHLQVPSKSKEWCVVRVYYLHDHIKSTKLHTFAIWWFWMGKLKRNENTV